MSSVPNPRTVQTILQSELLSSSAKVIAVQLLLTLPDDDESGTYTKVDVGGLERKLHMSKGSFSRSFPFLEAYGFFTRTLKFYVNDSKQPRTDTFIAHGSRILDRGVLGDLVRKKSVRVAKVNAGCKTCPLMRIVRKSNGRKNHAL